MRLSSFVKTIPASPTLAIAARAKALRDEGVDVLSFSAGEPDFGTPTPIMDAAKRALDAGATRYTPVGGTPALKRAIREYTERRTGARFEDAEIIASCGAKHTLYNLFLALLDPGDEVLLPVPAWVSYPVQIELTGARAVLVHGNAANQFLPTVQELDAACTERTRAILINNPSNPTGAFWSAEALAPIADWLVSRPDIVIISDAIYDELVYDGQVYVELLRLRPELRDRYVLVNGISKSFAMTGWRLGWACGPAPLVGAMTRLQSQSTSNPTAVTQSAAIEALRLGESLIAPMRSAFQARRDLMFALLAEVPGVTLNRPAGAFYAFPDFSSWIGRRTMDGEVLTDDLKLASWLLDAVQVAVVPGSPFFAPGFLRLSYATDEETIRRGIERLHTAASMLAGP
jgi:aspartate aminotransferase